MNYTQPKARHDQLIGWLPKNASAYGGLSDPPWNGGRGLVVFADDDYDAAEGGIIAAHELGHNLGHVHPCENTVWPYPADYDIQTIGFDPYESHYGSGTGVISPATSEFMTGGWCGATGAESKWISAYSYKRLIDSFTPLPMQSAATTALTAQAGQNILLVSGAVRADRIDIFDAYRVTSPKAVTLPRPDSGQAYCVALRDSGGVELDSFCFDMPDQGNNGMAFVCLQQFLGAFLVSTQHR